MVNLQFDLVNIGLLASEASSRGPLQQQMYLQEERAVAQALMKNCPEILMQSHNGRSIMTSKSFLVAYTSCCSFLNTFSNIYVKRPLKSFTWWIEYVSKTLYCLFQK